MTRVLVIDDEPRIVSFVQRALTANGIAAEGVTDGARGLAMTLTGVYELVLLDLLMPAMDGSSVLAQIMEHRPHQPVVILSALTDVDTRVRCFGLGAADYIAKPFALAELLARVHVRLRIDGSDRADTMCGGVRASPAPPSSTSTSAGWDRSWGP
jgi:two-component system copper resistance phosphate regulon response regulator CusR